MHSSFSTFQKLCILILLLFSFSLIHAQGTLLVKKGYKTKARFLPGKTISVEVENMDNSVYTGIIDVIGDDYFVINTVVIEIKNVILLTIPRGQINYNAFGTNIMIAGIGYPLIYLINGILDGSKQYYSKGTLITGASFFLSGWILKKIAYRKFNMTKKHYLRIIIMDQF